LVSLLIFFRKEKEKEKEKNHIKKVEILNQEKTKKRAEKERTLNVNNNDLFELCKIFV